MDLQAALAWTVIGAILTALVALVAVRCVHAFREGLRGPVAPPAHHPQAAIVCRFCHERGGVGVDVRTQRAGIDATKAGAAMLTGGASVLAVGLTGERKVHRLTCATCQMTWDDLA